MRGKYEVSMGRTNNDRGSTANKHTQPPNQGCAFNFVSLEECCLLKSSSYNQDHQFGCIPRPSEQIKGNNPQGYPALTNLSSCKCSNSYWVIANKLDHTLRICLALALHISICFSLFKVHSMHRLRV